MISLIIIVKNDRKIIHLLNKLQEISKPEKIEIIVVDSSNITLDDIKNNYTNIKWVHFPTTKHYTFSDQRNLGLKISKGEIIVFVDSDCIPKNNWLTLLTKPIIDNNENIVAGYVETINKKSINSIIWDKLHNKKYISVCPTLNMAIKKEVFSKIGTFNDYFNSGGEDYDFSWRATNYGYKIYYNRKAIVYHDWGTLKKEIKRALRGGKTSVKLYRKHPEKLKNVLTFNADFWIYPLFILLLPLSFIFPFYPLLLILPLIRNILSKSLRGLAVEKIFLDLVRGFGVLYECLYLERISKLI
jgi:cellulose synthase/poly-beta-1,6-N-acetylglucosamine synthase-like glycosyltransferase